MRLVGGIRKLLGFERDTVAHAIEMAGFANDRTIKKIACVKLKAWLGGQNLDDTTRKGVFESRSEARRCRLPLVEH